LYYPEGLRDLRWSCNFFVSGLLIDDHQ